LDATGVWDSGEPACNPRSGWAEPMLHVGPAALNRHERPDADRRPEVPARAAPPARPGPYCLATCQTLLKLSPVLSPAFVSFDQR
jgi:hypothetical protein